MKTLAKEPSFQSTVTVQLPSSPGSVNEPRSKLWLEPSLELWSAAADTLGALGAVDEAAASVETRALFAEIRAFYGSADVPPSFRFIAHDPLYAADVWAAAPAIKAATAHAVVTAKKRTALDMTSSC